MDSSVTTFENGRGSLVVKVTDSWLVCHDFEPGTTEDSPCRVAEVAERCSLPKSSNRWFESLNQWRPAEER
ncbi:hypothetical protein TNCV_865761 [Trichonephila clavipes]|nr:hypothetical protein TNCV_865761 [Trichonephila clavipes]